MKKTLITGGAGFIGGNFCHYELNKYPSELFVCLDALTYAGNLETLQDLLPKSNFKFIKGNICNKQLVKDLFAQFHFDNVINFAAETHVDRSIKNPEIFLKTNIIGTQNLLFNCVNNKINRFHQVSTDEVYGDLPIDRPDLRFEENSPLKTSSPYSASKAAADLLVASYHRTYGIPTTISRCSNNYGPYQFPEKLIPLMIQKIIKNEQLPIYGNGLNVRDWLYVEDHCEAIDLIVRYGQNGEVYNIGGNNEKSNIEIVKILLSYFNKSESLITFVKDRPGHDLRYAINPSKIEKELGWKPKHMFSDGIKETIKWYVINADWLKHVESGEYKKWMKGQYNQNDIKKETY